MLSLTLTLISSGVLGSEKFSRIRDQTLLRFWDQGSQFLAKNGIRDGKIYLVETLKAPPKIPWAVKTP